MSVVLDKLAQLKVIEPGRHEYIYDYERLAARLPQIDQCGYFDWHFQNQMSAAMVSIQDSTAQIHAIELYSPVKMLSYATDFYPGTEVVKHGFLPIGGISGDVNLIHTRICLRLTPNADEFVGFDAIACKRRPNADWQEWITHRFAL